MSKICTTCKIDKPFTAYAKGNGSGGKRAKCTSCLSEWSKSYEKTEDGFLMRVYRNMLSRVTGVQKQKYHLYKGKSILSKEDFYAWAKGSYMFKLLFIVYKHSGHQRKLAPSVDRIDSSLGYELDNIEWVTMSENSRRGTFSRYSREDIA